MTDAPDFQEDPLEPDEAEPDLADRSQSSVPLAWRFAAVAIAVAIILALLWPVLQQTRPPSPEATAPGRPADTSGEIAAGQTAVAADTGSAPAYFELGNSYATAGRWTEAVEAYQQALALDPEYLSAYANLGVAYYQLQELDKATEVYQQALAIDPNDADVTYNLGALYLQQALSGGGAPDEAAVQRAIDQIEQAATLNPNLPQPHFSLGVAYFTLGDTEQAIAEFERFQALDSGQDPEASQLASQYLEQLRGATGQ